MPTSHPQFRAASPNVGRTALHARRFVALGLAAVVTACGGGGDGDGGPTPPVGSIAIALSAATLNLIQGGAAGSVNVTLTRSGGFAGAVDVTIEGAPTGVTASASPASIASSGTTSTISVTAGATAAAGAATLTVRARGQGVTDQTAQVALTIAAAPVGGFTLSLNPASMQVQQGQNATTTVTITRSGGFAGSVTLSQTGAPNGLTATFNPASTTQNTSNLTLAAAQTLATGSHTLTVSGTAPGAPNQSVTLTVQVTAATGGGNTTWDFCAVSNLPLWFAFQDGTGAWQRVTPTGTRFTFNVASGRGGIAYVVDAGGAALAARTSASAARTARLMRRARTRANAERHAAGQLQDDYATTVLYGTQAELNSVGACPDPTVGSGKTVNGSVAGLGSTQQANISLGSAFVAVNGALGQNNFTLTDVPDGPRDLIASRVTQSLAGGSLALTVDKLIFRRAINPANNSTLSTLDFASTQAFDPIQRNVTLTGLGSDETLIISTYLTSTSEALLYLNAELVSGATRTYFGVPASQQLAGDLHGLTMLAAPSSGSDIRLLSAFFREATDRTFALGGTLNSATITVTSTTPYVRFRAQTTLPAAFDRLASVEFSQTVGASPRDWFIEVTAGYLGGSATLDVTVPDFTGVAGFNTAWGLIDNVETDWFVTGFDWTGQGIEGPVVADGAILQGALKAGTIVP